MTSTINFNEESYNLNEMTAKETFKVYRRFAERLATAKTNAARLEGEMSAKFQNLADKFQDILDELAAALNDKIDSL